MAKRDMAMRATLSVTLVIFFSKGLGFLREIIMAAYYGTSMEMDAYTAAYGLYYLPVLLFSSCITSTVVPMYIEARAQTSLKRANRFASNVTTLFSCFALIVSAAMMLLAEPLTRVVYPGFAPDKLALTVRLFRVMTPSLVFFVASIVMSSLLNAREKFVAAQLTGFPLSFALIAATVAFSHAGGVYAVAWGVFAAGVLQVIVQAPPLRGQVRFSAYLNLREPRFRRLLRMALPAVLSMSVYELNHLIDRALASGLADGSISAMNYGYRLITFLIGVLVVPVETITFSKMSKKAVTNDTRGVIATVTRSIEVVTLVVLPITAISILFRDDIIKLAYMRGRFSEQSVIATASAFAFYAVGLAGFGLRDLMNRAFHSLQDMKTPMRVAIFCVVLNVALNLALVRPMGASGLALATSISGVLGALSLIFLLRRRLGRLGGKRMAMELTQIGICAVACAFVSLVYDRLVPASTGSALAFLRLAGGMICALAVYCGCATVLGVRQFRFFANALRAKLHRQ